MGASSLALDGDGDLPPTFDGAIGEVQIYDRTLSPENVRRLYDAGAGKYSVKTGLK